jgi:hypothetical protein
MPVEENQCNELTFTLRQPFDVIAKTTAIEAKRKVAGDVSNDLSVIWLPFLDAYRTVCAAPPPQLIGSLA